MSRIDNIGQNGGEGLNYGTVYDTVHLDYNLHEYTPTIKTEVQDKCSGCMSLCEGCEPEAHDFNGNYKGSFDVIKKPKHYMIIPEKNVEARHIVQAVVNECVDLSGYQCHCLASAIEYLLRGHKKNGLEDYKKAGQLIEFLVQAHE